MSNPYIDGSTLDQCSEALRQGKQLDELAGKLRCSVDHLRLVLGLPTLNLATSENTDCDLWRVAEAERQL